MSPRTQLVVGTALRNMVEKGWVDICCIKECIKLAGVIPNGQALAELSALHCLHYKDMPPELVKEIPGMINDCFNGPKVMDFIPLTTPPGKSTPQWLERLNGLIS